MAGDQITQCHTNGMHQQHFSAQSLAKIENSQCPDPVNERAIPKQIEPIYCAMDIHPECI
jgi:hypothetical protein